MPDFVDAPVVMRHIGEAPHKAVLSPGLWTTELDEKQPSAVGAPRCSLSRKAALKPAYYMA
jgi:hypothetical protein